MTSGTFSLDGGTWDVDNNVWLVGDAREVLVVDAAHDIEKMYAPELGTVFTGDTLFEGGPGATGRSFSSFDTIIESLRHRVLTLPRDTLVRPGHGDSTTIGVEAPHLEEWIARES